MMEIPIISNEFQKSLHTEKTAAENSEDLSLRKQCTEFESFLYNCMLKTMRSTVSEDGLFSGGNAEKIYQSMLDQEYSLMMSEKMNSGIADALYKQLMQKQHKIETL
jgi:Rod binding domain-containing protein